jgi:hypothetical protein
MEWSGATTMGLHGADALYVQEDPTVAGYKVANVGAPSGTIDVDKTPGIAGFVGRLPSTTDITSSVTLATRSRDGVTHVTLPDWATDVTFAHMLSNMDRVFDALSEGSSTLSWTATGRREDGTRFRVRRAEVFGDPFDITASTAFGLASPLAQLQFNDVEDVTIDAVDANIVLDRDYEHASIRSVSIRRGGAWVKIKPRKVLELRVGTKARFRVALRGTDAAPRRVIFQVPVRRVSLGQRGSLVVTGGNAGFSEFFRAPVSVGRARALATVDDIIDRIESAPHNDDVIGKLRFRKNAGGVRQRQVSTGVAVDGFFSVRVRAVR